MVSTCLRVASCFSSFFPTCFRALSILMNGIGKNYDAWMYI